MEVHVSASSAALADDAADLITERLSRIDDRRANLALAGGSTPVETYRRLADRPIGWPRLDVWLSDERWVPHDSDESNGGMAKETLIDHVDTTLHRPRFSKNVEPEESAAFYEATLRSFVADGRPDVVLLGMGTDGHTASLFPGTAALTEDTERWFVANHVESLDTWRLTVTPYLLGRSRTILVIVTGEDKAEVLAEVVERPAGRYPIELLHGVDGEVAFLADEAAASRLT